MTPSKVPRTGIKKWNTPTVEDKMKFIFRDSDNVPKDKAKLNASILREIAIKNIT